MNRAVSPHRGNRRNAKSNRNPARASRSQGPVPQLDRGARIPTREMKRQMFILGAMLRMPAGMLGTDDTPAVREGMQKRLDYYKGLLDARDELAVGLIDGAELARRTEALTRAHYAA